MTCKPHAALAAAIAVSLFAGAAQAANIVQAAQADGHFTMLLKAVRQAGLEGKMMSPGPFTVFAPTDAAFAALPPATARRLMDPANKAELAKVLSYHTLAGRLTTAELGDKPRAAATLIGEPLVLDAGGPRVKVNDAHITKADMMVDNGVVQVIDKVLLPPTPIQPSF